MDNANAVVSETPTRHTDRASAKAGSGDKRSRRAYRRASPGPGFVAALGAMTPAQRLAGYGAGQFNLAEANVWASLYPEEVPTVNGEFEWIALTLADLD